MGEMRVPLFGLLIVAVVAGVVAFVGLRLAEGEPPPPRRATLSTPVPPSPSPEPQTAEPPSSMTIAGEEVALAPGVRYRLSETGPPGPSRNLRTIEYDSDPSEIGFSWLALDDEGRIAGSHILPKDLATFQPLLDAALPPLPGSISIGGKEVPLAPGMRYGELLPALGSTKTVWWVFYDSIPVKPEVSSLTLDEDGTIFKSHILPEDLPLFQPLLDAANESQ